MEFPPNMNDTELDAQMKAMGVPMDQRKRIIAAAKLGVPNPLKELGLTLPTAMMRPSPQEGKSGSPLAGRASRSAGDASAAEQGALSVPATAAPQLPGGVERASERKTRAARVARVKSKKEDEEQDLDGFLAGGRAATAAMAKAKAAERARQEQMARDQADRERRQQEQFLREQEAERKRQQEEKEKEEEERRLEARRQARREERLKRKEQRKQQKAMEEDEDFQDAPSEEDEDLEREEPDPRRRRLAKGFFSQAYKGNEEAKRLWSEPIKGQVSNHYRGFTDADLDRRFGAQSGRASAADAQKLMTEEEVLALLRKGKASKS